MAKKKPVKKPMTFAEMAREGERRRKAGEKLLSKPTAKAKAVIADPELGNAGLTKADRRAVVLGLAARIVKKNEGAIYPRYVEHFTSWRDGAGKRELHAVHDAIAGWVDEGYLDHLHRHLAIQPFLFSDDNFIVHETSRLYCIHHPVVGRDRLYGVKDLLGSLVGRARSVAQLPADQSALVDPRAEAIAHGLSAILACGDKRVLPLLEAAWPELPSVVRLHLAVVQEEMPTEIEAKFWLRRAAEAEPGSGDFRLAMEHLILMTDESSRNFAIFTANLSRRVFNFGLERGADESRSITNVAHDRFLNDHADILARIEASPANKPLVARLLKAWGCVEA